MARYGKNSGHDYENPDNCDCQYCRTARAIANAPGDDEAEEESDVSESVRIEWGVQWPGDDEIEQGSPAQLREDGGEAYARRVAKHYHASGARLVQSEVRRGVWTAAE